MKQLSVAMLGFGNADKAFSRILLARHEDIKQDYGVDVQVTAIDTGSRGSLADAGGIDLAEAICQAEAGPFDRSMPAYCEKTTMEVVEAADYDVVLELTPVNIFTGEPASTHLRRAMERGKHVISANKGPIAWHYRELKDLARAQGVGFLYETTVMAGMPVFNMADTCLEYCRVKSVKGIFSATTNYILKEMGRGIAMEDILEAGRRGGFMEADTSMDILGWDAAAKLTALLNVLMDAGLTPDLVEREGIENITPRYIDEVAARGNVIKLLCQGSVSDGRVRATVKPTELPRSDVFAGEDLAAVLTLDTDLLDKMTLLQYRLDTSVTGYGVFGDLLRVLRML